MSDRQDMAVWNQYGDVDVSRVGSRVRLKQEGDGSTDEVYIPFGEVGQLVEQMQEATPGGE